MPEGEVEPTHVGPWMDAIVARAKRNALPAGVDRDYDEVRAHFDHLTFLLQAVALQEQPSADPVRVFLRNGADAVNTPDVNFSMKQYLARHPERASEPSPYLAWLREGRAAGEIADPAAGLEQVAPVLGLEPQALADVLAETRDDLGRRLRTGTLGEMFAKAAEIEPLVGAVWVETTRPKLPPLPSPVVAAQLAALHACHEAAGFRPARLVLVINRPRWGGGRRVEGHLTHALADRLDPRDVVVVYTDESGTTPAGRFPRGVREIDFAALVGDLPPAAADRVLVELIRSLRADSVVNINSRALYRSLVSYGRALAASERIWLCLFCNEQRAQGHWDGWSLKHYYRNVGTVAGVLTDSEHLRDQLTERYLLPESERARIHVLRSPVEPEIALAPPPPGRERPRVYWAGRWDRQKRVDLAVEVARRLPELDFRLWGEPVLQGDPIGDVPENVRLEPAYAHLSELDLGDADVWLYTSAWDGVPSLLLEIGMTGVPLVASRVGGVGEVLTDEDARLVTEVDDPDAYVDGIRAVLADPGRARERARALRERLVRDRSQQAYADQVAPLLLTEARRPR